MFCWGSAMRLPASIVSVASAGRHRHPAGRALARRPRSRRGTSATNPAAFGATLSHATNGVVAASYVSGTHMWNGKAAILNAKPARAASSPSVSSGPAPADGRAISARSVVPVAP